MQPQYPYAVPSEIQFHTLRQDNYSRLRKHGILVGACLLGYFAIQEFLGFVLSLFGLGAMLRSNLALQNALGSLVFTFVAMGVPFFSYSSRKGQASYFKAIPFHTPQPRKRILLVVIAGWAICISGNYVASMFGDMLSNFGVKLLSSGSSVSRNPLDVAMNFVSAGFMAPLMEEFVFRGVIMQPLRRYGDSFAVVSTAFLFAMAHGNPISIVFAFVAGLAIGYAVVYTRSLWVGIIIHALNNLMSVFVGEVGRFAPFATNLFYIVFCAVLLVSGVVCLIVFGKKYGFRLPEDYSGLSSGQKFKALFISLTMLPALLYFFYSMSGYILNFQQ